MLCYLHRKKKKKITPQKKKKISIKDFFSKCDQIHRFLRIWSHLLKKSLIENFIFCAVLATGGCYKNSALRQKKFGKEQLYFHFPYPFRDVKAAYLLLLSSFYLIYRLILNRTYPILTLYENQHQL